MVEVELLRSGVKPQERERRPEQKEIEEMNGKDGHN